MVVVLFRSRLRDPDDAEYAELAPRMLELARSMPGFVSFKQFRSDDGERLALVEFESPKALDAWRRHPEHQKAQQLGRERFYSSYEVTACEVTRSYEFDGDRRTAAP